MSRSVSGRLASAVLQGPAGRRLREREGTGSVPGPRAHPLGGVRQRPSNRMDRTFSLPSLVDMRPCRSAPQPLGEVTTVAVAPWPCFVNRARVRWLPSRAAPGGRPSSPCGHAQKDMPTQGPQRPARSDNGGAQCRPRRRRGDIRGSHTKLGPSQAGSSNPWQVRSCSAVSSPARPPGRTASRQRVP